MNPLKNLKVGTKIITGYLIILVLMAIVGGVAIIRLNSINQTVDYLAGNLAGDQHLIDTVSAKMWTLRFLVNRYTNLKDPTDLAEYHLQMNNLQNMMNEFDQDVVQGEQGQRINQIKTDLESYQTGFDEVVELISQRSDIQANILDVQGPLAENKLNLLRNNASSFAKNDSLAGNYSADAQRVLLSMRLNAFKYLEAGDTHWLTKFDEDYQQLQKTFTRLESELDSSQQSLAKQAQTAADTYATSFTDLQAGYARQNEIMKTILPGLGDSITEAGAAMSDEINVGFQAAKDAAQTLVYQTIILILFLLVAAIVGGLGVGWSLPAALPGRSKL
jgi:methyl-accepting chemotaxis protein